MKRKSNLFAVASLLALTALTHTASAATYNATTGYVGAQTAMMPTDANVAAANPLIFNTTSGYFTVSAATITYSNANVLITSLLMNNGNGASVTNFTGTVTGAGNVVLITAGLAQDFVFAGNMQGYSGAMRMADRTGVTNALANNASNIIQFGGTTAGGTVALGTITGPSPDRIINSVAGTGALGDGTGAINQVVFNYATDASYDYLVATNNINSRYSVYCTGNANMKSTGVISGGAQMIKQGTGTVTLAGANTFTGATTISAGTLKAGVASTAGVNGALGNNSAVTLANVAGAGLDITGFNTQIGSLTGGGATGGNIALGANTLTIGASNTSPAAYAGAISGSGGAVTKIGSGTLTLSGTNTYTGGTSINAGTLAVTGSLSGSAVSVASTATLGGTGTVGATTVASGGLLAPGTAGAGKLTTGNLAFSGTSTITLGAYTGYTTAPAIAAGALITSGVVTINLGGASAVSGTYPLLSYTGGSIGGTGASAFVLGTKPTVGGRQSQALVDTGSALNWVVAGASPIWSGAQSSEWSTNVIGGSSNWKLQGSSTATDYLAGDVVMFDDSAITTTLDLSVADVAPASMLFSNAAQSYTIQGSHGITSGSLYKTGAGGLTINTANSFAGGATLGGGTITLGSATALGSGSVALNAGTLAMNGQLIGNAVVLGGGAITGTGGIGGNVTGSSLSYATAGGTLILAGTNPIAATIAAGATLQIGAGSAAGTIGNVANAGALVFNRSDASTYSGAISGIGSVLKSGAGTLTFSAANSYSGATSVSDTGRLVVTSTLLNSAGFNVGTGATLEVGYTNVFVSGHGTAMAASRVLTVNGGTLLMNSNFEARFGNVSLVNGATWTCNRALNSYDALLSDTTAGPATVTVSGTGVSTMNGATGIHLAGVQNFDVADVTANSDPDLIVSMILGSQGTAGGLAGGINKLGAGTMVLAGTNTYTGATTINAGTLQVGNGGTTGNMGTGTVTNNTALVLNYGAAANVGLANVISGAGTLTKQGLGLVALTGASNYTGATTVNQGVLRIGNHLDSSDVTVQSGGAIGAGSQSAAGTGFVKSLTLASGSGSTFRAGIAFDQLVVNDAGGLVINGPHVITAVSNGGLVPGDKVPIIDYSGTLGGGGYANLSLAPGSRFTLSNNLVDTTIDLTYTGGAVTWKGNVSSQWDLDTTANWDLGGSPTHFLTGDEAVFDDTATTGNVVLVGTQAAAAVTISNSTLAYTLSGGTLGGTSNLTKQGSGTATITSATSYTGTTFIDEGTLTFGDGATSGEVGPGPVSLLAGATLRINRSDLLDYKANPRLRKVGGAGDVVLDGGAVLFNYPGTGVGFGESGSWAGLSGNLTVKGGSEFRTIRNGATAMGSGSVILGDATTSGILSQIEGNWTWTNNISLVGSANKILNRSLNSPRTLKIQGVISGSGALSFEDPALGMQNIDRGFILTGTNTLSGTLTIAAGVPVRVGGVPGNTDVTQSGADAFGSLGTATVVDNGTLTFSRTDAHTVTNAISGTGALRVGIPLANGFGDTTTQILTYTGTATHSGATTVNNGTLIIDAAASMGGSSVAVAAGATLKGNGTVAAPLTAAGTIAPGVGVGTLTVNGNTSLSGILAIEVNATADKLAVTGDLSVGGAITVSESGAGFTAASYVIAECSGTLTGTLSAPGGYAVTNIGSQVVLSKVPGYAGWIAGFALGGQTGINQDPDHDGVANGLEFVLKGGNPALPNTTQLPTATSEGDNLVFRFERDDRAKAADSGIILTVEAGTDLNSWPEVFVIGADTAGSTSPAVVISNDGDSTPDTVTVTIPRNGAVMKFARLKVVGTP